MTGLDPLCGAPNIADYRPLPAPVELLSPENAHPLGETFHSMAAARRCAWSLAKVPGVVEVELV